jgi:hypothetical protein
LLSVRPKLRRAARAFSRRKLRPFDRARRRRGQSVSHRVPRIDRTLEGRRYPRTGRDGARSGTRGGSGLPQAPDRLDGALQHPTVRPRVLARRALGHAVSEGADAHARRYERTRPRASRRSWTDAPSPSSPPFPRPSLSVVRKSARRISRGFFYVKKHRKESRARATRTRVATPRRSLADGIAAPRRRRRSRLRARDARNPLTSCEP